MGSAEQHDQQRPSKDKQRSEALSFTLLTCLIYSPLDDTPASLALCYSHNSIQRVISHNSRSFKKNTTKKFRLHFLKPPVPFPEAV
jgi:hypothetical protein